MGEFVVWVNDREYRHITIDITLTLLQYLRSKGLTGTKLGCGEGGCGACTVVLGKYQSNCKVRYYSINACLTPLPSVHECHILTVEGIGTINRPHLIQKEMSIDGSQCGFCTPGIVMSMYAAWRNGEGGTQVLDGNLCRCTGYRPIIDAMRRCGLGDKCCQVDSDKMDCGGDALIKARDQEIIFPPKLKVHLERNGRNLVTFERDGVKWNRPVTLVELLKLKQNNPKAHLVMGNTEVGIEIKQKGVEYSEFIYTGDIDQLDYIEELESFIEVGSAVTLDRLRRFCLDKAGVGGGESKYGNLEPVKEMIKWFAGNQIRNVAGWAGNLITASPISDLNPVWMSIGAVVNLASVNGYRSLLVKDFMLGYRKVDLLPGEVIISLNIPYSKPNEYVAAHKQAKRRDDDITIVNGAFRVLLDPETSIVQECSLVYGGMGAVTRMSVTTTKALIGRVWIDPKLLDEIMPTLREEFILPVDVVGGMPEYRTALVTSLFFKFYLYVCNAIGMELDDRISSAIVVREHQSMMTGARQFIVEEGSTTIAGRPIAHMSALKHSTGTARFVDDQPRLENELYAGLVLSTHAHAKIVSIDSEAALAIPGVMAIITYKDVPGTNRIGPVFQDEFIFAEDIVTSCGQIVVMTIALNQQTAQRAAKLIKVEYKDIEPLILTIEEAIAAGSFFSQIRTISRGEIDTILDSASEDCITIKGNSHINGQEHFYLETQAALVIPNGTRYEVIASTQNPTEGQHFVGKVLGIPFNMIECRTERLGGGFGGKETRSSFLIGALAVAAHKMERPVRCMLDRNEDMIFSGQRHPFKMDYTLMMEESSGRILGADILLYSDGGHSMDLSLGVMDRAISHIDNAYYFPAIRVIGRICKTNLPSNTAFRGFGGPQANYFCEVMLTRAARVLGMEVETLRRINLYGNVGLETPFKMRLEGELECPLIRMWDQLMADAEFKVRKEKTVKFNQANRWSKRGISMVPTKFGIAFGVRHLNQAGALVHIYTDGSVMITHGGVEMGQGLHTKVCQVAAEAFGIELNQVSVAYTSTMTVANSSPTAASASSDLYGMAVLDACQQIIRRLEGLKKSHPELTFEELVGKAYLERVDLSAHGFHATPDLNYNWNDNTGRLYNYFTYGVACSEVEVDILTGDHTIIKSDILMDLGQSLNPTIDIGQIEGAFVQGLGLFTTEQPLYLRNGMMLNRGPGGYKIPTASDIPRELHVRLLEDSVNTRAIHSSKAVGEPPLFLSASVFFAIEDAVRAARIDAHNEGHLVDLGSHVMDSPATVERIRLACGDYFIPDIKDDGRKTWCFSA
jgi:xanthine dehydrogenase/oxidase